MATIIHGSCGKSEGIASYALTITVPTGVTSVTVTRTVSGLNDPKLVGVIDDTRKIYAGDVLVTSGTAETGYTTPTGITYEVAGDTVATVNTGVGEEYTLTTTIPSGVASITVTRTSSQLGGSIGVITTSDPIYFGDTLTTSGTGSTGYGTPTGISYTVSGDTNVTVTVGAVLEYEFSIISPLPTGVSSISVSRTASPLKGADLGVITTSDTIYYGDILTATATAETGYTAPSNVSYQVESNLTITTANAVPIGYALTVTTPTGVDAVIITRTSSPISGETGVISASSAIYYGDILVTSGIASTGYSDPTGESYTVSGDTSVTVTAGTILEYTLTITSTMPTGVASISVSRTSSPLKGATVGVLASGDTIYYSDTLTATATADTGYTAPTPTDYVVTSDITATTGNATPTAYTLTITVPTGVSSVTVTRTSSTLGGSIGVITASNAIYYGDVLNTSGVAEDGYDDPTGLTYTVSGNTTVTVTAGEISSTDFLTFQSDTAFTLDTYNTSANWNGTIYYSTDTTTWEVWQGTSIASSASGVLYLRGVGNTYINTSSVGTNGRFVFTNATNLQAIGDIDYILDWETVANGGRPTMATYCYGFMFRNCTSLTTAPSLPATTLATYCYYSMFYNCTSLTTAPSLPATTLAERCYNNMLVDCTSLTTAPSLPATTLATYCYRYMFNGCTSLTTAPSLPATTLAAYCYHFMFADCTLLKIASSYNSTSYPYAWRIPTSGTGTTATSAMTNMLQYTGGTYTSDPTINTTYYAQYQPV